MFELCLNYGQFFIIFSAGSPINLAAWRLEPISLLRPLESSDAESSTVDPMEKVTFSLKKKHI